MEILSLLGNKWVKSRRQFEAEVERSRYLDLLGLLTRPNLLRHVVDK
jgi:hypothetical protein